MLEDIGKIALGSGEVLLKMWRVQVETGQRVLRHHSHTQFEVVYVEQGSGTYTTAKNVYPIEQGDMFIFSSNEVHCVTDVGTKGLVLVNLHFEPRYLLEECADAFSAHHAGLCFSHAESFQNRIISTSAQDIKSCFALITSELSDRKTEYALAVRSALNLLLICLIRSHGYEAEAKASMSQAQIPTIAKAMTYIEGHLSESLSLTEIAQFVGVSPNYFSALFHKICNMSLWEYLTAKRVEKAIQMICMDGDETMIEIALSCGFNNTANFNKAFKKQTGVTPSYYRNNKEQMLG